MDEQNRQALYKAACEEANGLYSQMITVATLLLGGSLFVIEKLRPSPETSSFWLVALGGASLLGSLALTVIIRFRNLRSMEWLAKGWHQEAEACDRRNKRVTWAAVICVSVGVLLSGLGVLLAAAHPRPEQSTSLKATERERTMSEKKEPASRPDRPETVEKKAIPSSSFFPEQPVKPEQPGKPQEPQSGGEGKPSQSGEGGSSSGANRSD